MFIRKWGGDDRYSWAVFVEGQMKPVVSGLGRDEAVYHKGVVEKLLREKAERQAGESLFGTKCRACGSTNLRPDQDEPRVADCLDCGSFNIGPDSEVA